MGFKEQLTEKIKETGRTKVNLQQELEISQWKLDGFSSGRIKAKKWEQVGIIEALDRLLNNEL